MNEGRFDMNPDMTSTLHQQAMPHCILLTNSYSIPLSPIPVIPFTQLVPYMYSSGDSVTKTNGVGNNNQSAGSVSVISNSQADCDSSLGCGSHLNHKLYPILPNPLHNSCNVENQSNSGVLDNATEESTGTVGCVDECPVGDFGPDGCWYPFAEDKTSGSVIAHSLVQINKSRHEHFPEQCQLHISDIKCLPNISPFHFDMMRPTPNGVNLKPYLRDLPTPPFYNFFHYPRLSPNASKRTPLLPSFHKKDQLCVEDLWKMHMALLFKHLPHQWLLEAIENGIQLDQNWNYFKDLAKVRFHCTNCDNGWTSMYGVAVFYYKLDSSCFHGHLLYDIPGQKCRRCMTEEFEKPMWYPEEAQKVITNLYYKIASSCYNLTTPQSIGSRRLGQSQGQHDRSLCQGCFCYGLCKEGKIQNSDDNSNI